MNNQAAFYLDKYQFRKIQFDYSKKTNAELEIVFNPEGVFKSETSEFELKIVFSSKSHEADKEFISIECIADFKFESASKFEDIPTYFYRNSIAIVFPYIRAFIGTVTLQANIPPLILPTLNLSSLEQPLRDNTKKI